MDYKLIQITPAQENMYLLCEGEDEEGEYRIEEKVVALGLQSDGSIMLIIINQDGMVDYIDADRDMKLYRDSIIFK